MVTRTLLLATAAMVLIAQPLSADAQTTPPTRTQPTTAAVPSPGGADTRNLIGRNILNPQNETIGEINSVHIDSSGKVDSVIAGVGGFLGMGEREVALRWSDLQVSQDGTKVVANMTKDQLKALPAYKYREASYRGTVFSDTPPAGSNVATVAPAAGKPATVATATPAAPAAGKPATIAAATPVTGNTLIGAVVHNMQDEKIGTVDDLLVGTDGKISSAVVSVGGFLGMGTRHVIMDWSALTVQRDRNTLVIKTNTTKDALKGMPEYKYQRIAG